MDETHELLLALAGRVDDDLLAWARELVAVGEDTRAVELVTAGLSADRVALPAAVRAATVEAAGAARIDLDADAALPPATADEPEPGHRFTSGHEDERLTAAVLALPVRLLDGAGVQVAWRTTPAGTAPGPLPHPVLLVEVQPGGRPADALAYQLQVALDRAGVVASVEVLVSGRPVPAYHVAARREARPLSGSASPDPVPAQPDDEPAPAPLDEQRPVSPAVPLRPAADGSGRRRRLVPEPAPAGPASRPAEQRRPTVTPISRNALPSPMPLLRRDGGPARPLAPADEATDQPAPSEAPTFRSMQDPLNGPLNAPLLAPLLDPTPAADDDEYDDDQEYDSAAFGATEISPLAPEGEAPPVEDGWAGEWASGDWAVGSTDLDGADPAPVAPVAPVAPADPVAPEPRAVARHRFNGPPQPPLPAPPPLAPVQQRPALEPPPAAPQPDLGLRPDSLARLSDADRELLARLQAELGAAARKPRLTRRAGVIQNGNGRPPHPA